MKSKFENRIKIMFATIVFVVIYVAPMVLQYKSTGADLPGNTYQLDRAYIENLTDLADHFIKHFYANLNLIMNPLVWFFLSAACTQKLISWMSSYDRK